LSVGRYPDLIDPHLPHSPRRSITGTARVRLTMVHDDLNRTNARLRG
jgi:hypothetical protein